MKPICEPGEHDWRWLAATLSYILERCEVCEQMRSVRESDAPLSDALKRVE